MPNAHDRAGRAIRGDGRTRASDTTGETGHPPVLAIPARSIGFGEIGGEHPSRESGFAAQHHADVEGPRAEIDIQSGGIPAPFERRDCRRRQARSTFKASTDDSNRSYRGAI